MNTTSFLGYLTWWTIPDCAAPYAELNDLAMQVGFPSGCVPTPPAPRHAWEKAEGDLARVKADLEAAGAPWTPGR